MGDSVNLVQAQAKPASSSLSTLHRTGFLQRKCACGGTAGLSGQCEQCQKDHFLGTPRNRLQKKLTINEPGDQYEQEADRIANAARRLAAY